MVGMTVLILSIILSPENAVSCLHQRLHLLYNIQLHFKLLLMMEANAINPDQTAPFEQSDPCAYCY